MKHRIILILCALLAAVFVAAQTDVYAGLGGLKDKVKKKAEKKAEEKAEKAIEGEGDSGEGESSGDATTGEGGGGGGESVRPGEGVWANYDFVPGDNVIFFEDFSKTGVGDFPARLDFKNGNMEVVQWKNRNWLRATNDAEFEIPLPDNLPQKFTFEFDYYGPSAQNTVEIRDGSDNQETNHYLNFFWYQDCGIKKQGNWVANTQLPARAKEKIAFCRIMGDGNYLKVYVNDVRVANVPKSTFGRSSSIPVKIWASEDSPTMIGNIRIAQGGKQIMYEQLMADGKVVTQGILFASGSDEIKPESTPTLKDIGTMLKEHEELKISIEGHTDNVGEDAMNQSLSEKRAAAVKAFLMEKYGIAADRLQSKGLGETKPVAGNDTPEGRQNNRRVELVKL